MHFEVGNPNLRILLQREGYCFFFSENEIEFDVKPDEIDLLTIDATLTRNDDYHELLTPRLIALQERIQSAVMTGIGWEGVPDDLRRRADTPWFRSLLQFDPAKTMDRVRQPVLILQPALDKQVRPHHGPVAPLELGKLGYDGPRAQALNFLSQALDLFSFGLALRRRNRNRRIC